MTRDQHLARLRHVRNADVRAERWEDRRSRRRLRGLLYVGAAIAAIWLAAATGARLREVNSPPPVPDGAAVIRLNGTFEHGEAVAEILEIRGDAWIAGRVVPLSQPVGSLFDRLSSGERVAP